MNIKVQVIRTLDDGTQTTGNLFVSGDQTYTCSTLERPYLNNQRGISCIPAGRYICVKKDATEAIPYQHISITNVPNRSGVAIHTGNLYSQSKGCILVGKNYADINKDGHTDVLNSRNTFTQLMNVLPDEFSLQITEAITKSFPKTILS